MTKQQILNLFEQYQVKICFDFDMTRDELEIPFRYWKIEVYDQLGKDVDCFEVPEPLALSIIAEKKLSEDMSKHFEFREFTSVIG